MKYFSSPSSFAVIALFTASRITDLRNSRSSTFFSFNKGHINSMLPVAADVPFNHHSSQRIFLALTHSPLRQEEFF